MKCNTYIIRTNSQKKKYAIQIAIRESTKRLE